MYDLGCNLLMQSFLGKSLSAGINTRLESASVRSDSVGRARPNPTDFCERETSEFSSRGKSVSEDFTFRRAIEIGFLIAREILGERPFGRSLSSVETNFESEENRSPYTKVKKKSQFSPRKNVQNDLKCDDLPSSPSRRPTISGETEKTEETKTRSGEMEIDDHRRIWRRDERRN